MTVPHLFKQPFGEREGKLDGGLFILSHGLFSKACLFSRRYPMGPLPTMCLDTLLTERAATMRLSPSWIKS